MAVVIPEGLASFDADRLHPPMHTVIALEEPKTASRHSISVESSASCELHVISVM